MEIKNVSGKDLSRAIAVVSKKFDNNVAWNRYEQKGKRFYVTLRVSSSHGKGAKLGYRGRHTINACWHVHGEFVNALLALNPKAVIKTMLGTYDINHAEWIDRNIGSIMEPLAFSNACECTQQTETEYGTLKATTKIISQNRLTSECWLVQFNGLAECETCESKGKAECGGKRIRNIGRNSLGFSVPL